MSGDFFLWKQELDRMDLLYPYGGILLAPVAAGCLASMLSRLCRWRGKRPAYGVALVSSVAGVFTTWICTSQFDPFIPSRWASAGGKVDLLDLLAVTGFLAAAVSIVPAALIVNRHRRV